MKIKWKSVWIAIIFLVLFAALATNISAANAAAADPVYIVEASGDGLVASSGTDSYTFSDAKTMLYALSSDGVSFEFRDVAVGEINITKDVTLSGSLTVSGGNITVSSECALDGLSLTLDGGSLRIKGGEVSVKESVITSGISSAVILDYSAASVLRIDGGEISSSLEGAAIDCRMGSVIINSGSVRNPYGFAVDNSATLYIGGSSVLEGHTADVKTDRPIHLSVGANPFSGSLSVMYDKTFEKGSFEEVLLDVDEKGSEDVTLFDANGEKVSVSYFESSEYSEEKCFIAAYIPYRVKFYAHGELYHTADAIKDEAPLLPATPQRAGYTFGGWYLDTTFSDAYIIGSAPNGDINLYASFALMPPEFALSSLSFTYDGSARELEFEKLSHPLSDKGEFSFVWYKDGVRLDVSSSSVPVLSVSDNGNYFCKLTFAYDGDFVTVVTPNVSVCVDKFSVKAPTVPSAEYTGKLIYPSVPENKLYKSSFTGATDAGIYPVTLILTDTENYKWESSDADTVTLNFEILTAENTFTVSPSVKDGYEGVLPTVIASAKFGEPKYFYSVDGVTFTEGLPFSVGEYYLMVFVSGTGNYTELVSEPISFSILTEKPIGIMMDKAPDKTLYTAFETVDLTGAAFIVTYNSGRSAEVENSSLQIIYKKGNCLYAADTSVAVFFGGVSCPLEVSVTPASYDISGIRFEDSSAVYNAAYNTVYAEGSVVGLDGIPLTYTVKGGGINVGVYTVTLTFSTESPNYKTPDDIEKALTVLPFPVTVTYSSLTFTYDGTMKLPEARAAGILGNPLSVVVSGGATDAGEYTASASITDKNYTVINPSVNYVIEKAELDLSGVYWSEGDFLYNGSRHSVELLGLPEGVAAVGYANAAATYAGEYLAEVTLSFNEKNYNAPAPITCEWRIRAAEYDFSSFNFIDSEYVFDGKLHYPKSVGSLPVGYDSSSPNYAFSCGVTHVNEGRVSVTVTFSSGSKNYLTPAPVSVFVSVLPKSITVEWQNTLFTYNGSYLIPSAISDECEITVTGGATDAGEYIAEASADSSDYTVENCRIAFRIAKRENLWLTAPGIPSFYTSGEPQPFGSAHFGTAEYSYYLDEELKTRIDYPSSAGVYYMKASVPESKNYLPLESSPIKFSVVAVAPSSLEVKILTESFTAMSTLSAKDVSAYYINNDGTVTLIAFDGIDVVYKDGKSLKFSDSSVTFKAGGFSYTAPVNMKKAVYDMSGVAWMEEHHIYDGTPKSAYITGLPEDVSLVEYTLPSAVSAGTYKLSAVLDFDRENYYAPELPDGWLIIDKCPVDLPNIGSFEYDKQSHSPVIPESPLYAASFDSGISAGKYKVYFTLTDSQNYEFRDGICEKYYEISPRVITVEINSDRKSYKLVSGSIMSGDELFEEFYSSDGYVYMRSGNTNYRVTVIPIREKGFKDYLPLILILLLVLVLITLAIYIWFKRRESVVTLVYAVKERFKRKPEQKAESLKNDSSHLEMLMMVDEAHANALISDSIAKSLISDEKDSVKTDGKRRVIVNIDSISEAFCSGDVVDINKMKQKGLIPKDAFTVKVLARGVIDKPLTVIANAFSISAVKMIALTGGSAKRVRSVREGK